MKFLHSFVLLLLLLSTLHAEKVLYLTYEDPPTRVVQGEYFPLTVKLLSTIGQYNNIHYSFTKAKRVTVLHKSPSRVKKGNYYYDTFYLTASSRMATTPKITATLNGNHASLEPLPLEVVVLNPKKNYANVVADSFKITKYKTTVYDKENNIVVFNAKTLRCNLSKFKLPKIKKQGFETKRFGIRAASMTYYAVIPKEDDNLIFTYFNLRKQKFEKVVIPIIVDDDRVSTQSNLKPKEGKHKKIKMIAAGTVLVIALGFLLFKRNIWFFKVEVFISVYSCAWLLS